MIKKCTAMLLAALSVLTFSACSGNGNNNTEGSVGSTSAAERSEESSDTVQEVSSSGPSYLVKDADTPVPSASTLQSPIEAGSWGKAAKLCLKDNSYVDVPVRVVSVRRGTDVNKEVKEKMDASSFNYYFEPSDDEEYALVEYEICLDGFPVKEGGITCDVTAFITGSDGQSLKLKNGSYWGATASCLDNETYYYEGIVHSEMAYRIPKEVKEYILTIGEYGENQAFVSIH